MADYHLYPPLGNNSPKTTRHLSTQSKTGIFISYARADDETFVERLHNDLKDEFNVWWDHVSMPNRGLTFLQEIRDAIDHADRLLLVAGPSAFRSDYVRDEWQYAYQQGKAINIALRLGDYSDLPEELRNFDAPDFRNDGDYDKRLATLNRQLMEPIARMGSLHGVPALPPHFLNRPDALNALRELVIADVDKPTLISSEKRTTAVEGMGGIGKSVLATAFAHDRKVRFAFNDGIVWLAVGREAKLYELYRAVGIALGDELGNYPDETTARQNAQKRLVEKKCLLILDDVWELSVGRAFRDLISGTPARLLITTRNLQINDLLAANEYRLKLVDESQAVDYLRGWIGDDPDLAQVAEELGYLFLALKLAGARMKKDGLRGKEYLKIFDRVSRMKIDRQSTDREDSLEASITLSVDAAFAGVEDAKLFYYTFGIFQEDTAIPQQTILQLWGHLRPDVDNFDLSETLNALVDLALVEQQEDKTITLHDLLHSYTYEKLGNRHVQTHQALLDSYEIDEWTNLPTDEPYMWNKLAYHLVQAERLHRLHTLLIESKDWMERKYILFRTDESYIADIDIALSQLADFVSGEQLPNLIHLWAAKILVQDRTTVWDDIDLEIMTRIGRSEDALFFARIRTDPFERCKALSHVASAVIEMKKVVSRDIFAVMESSAQSIVDKLDKVNALCQIAELYIKAMQPTEAFRVTEIIFQTPVQYGGERDIINGYLHVLATEFANTNQPHFALNTANLIQYSFLSDYRASAIGATLHAFGFAGDITEGLKWASQLDQHQSYMYLKLLEGLLAGGHKDYKAIAAQVEISAKDELSILLQLADLLSTRDETYAKHMIEAIADALIIDHPYILQPPPESQKRFIKRPIDIDINVLIRLGKLLSKIRDPRSQQFTAWVLHAVESYSSTSNLMWRIYLNIASIFSIQHDLPQFSNFVAHSLSFVAKEFSNKTTQTETLSFIFAELQQKLKWEDIVQLFSTITDSDWRFTCFTEWIKYSIRNSLPVNLQAIEAEIQQVKEKKNIDKMQRITCVVAEIDITWAEQLFRQIQNYRQLEETNRTRSDFDRLREKLLFIYAKCSRSIDVNIITGFSMNNQVEIRLKLAEWFIDINVDIARALLEKIDSFISWQKYRLAILWARLGEIERAVKIGETYSADNVNDIKEWPQFVIALAQQGYVSEAKHLFEGKEAEYAVLGKIYTYLGDDEGLHWSLLAVEKTLSSYPAGKAEALTEIAIALLATAHPLADNIFNDAVAAAHAITDSHFEGSGMRNLQLRDMAINFARRGFPEKALLIFDSMSRSGADDHFHQDRNSILRAAILSFCEKGEVETVLQLKLISKFDDYYQSGRYMRTVSMSYIARALCSKDDVEQALEYIRQISAKEVLSEGLRDLAAVMIRRQQVKSALLTLSEAHPVDYVDAYSNLILELESIYPQQVFETLGDIFAIFAWLDPVWTEMQTWVNQLRQ